MSERKVLFGPFPGEPDWQPTPDQFNNLMNDWCMCYDDVRLERVTVEFPSCSYSDGSSATIMFAVGGLTYRVAIQLPDPTAPEFNLYKQGSSVFQRTQAAAQERYGQELNRRWRALGAVIKAKLIATDEKIVTFEEEFLAYAVTGDGLTVGQHTIPALQAGAKAGKVPSALPLPGVGR